MKGELTGGLVDQSLGSGDVSQNRVESALGVVEDGVGRFALLKTGVQHLGFNLEDPVELGVADGEPRDKQHLVLVFWLDGVDEALFEVEELFAVLVHKQEICGVEAVFQAVLAAREFSFVGDGSSALGTVDTAGAGSEFGWFGSECGDSRHISTYNITQHWATLWRIERLLLVAFVGIGTHREGHLPSSLPALVPSPPRIHAHGKSLSQAFRRKCSLLAKSGKLLCANN